LFDRSCYKQLTNILYSIEDDTALKAKVDEALAVYDDYVKAQGSSEGGEAKKEEETKA
jgi:polyadenylate-binding protein